MRPSSGTCSGLASMSWTEERAAAASDMRISFGNVKSLYARLVMRGRSELPGKLRRQIPLQHPVRRPREPVHFHAYQPALFEIDLKCRTAQQIRGQGAK